MKVVCFWGVFLYIAKAKTFDETNMKWIGVCRVTFSFATCCSSLTMPTISTNPNWERVCIFLCHETLIEGNHGSHLVYLLRIQKFNPMLSTDARTFDTSSTPTSVEPKFFMFLFLSTGRVLVPSCPENFCFQEFFLFLTPHLDIFTVALELARCHHLLDQIFVLCFRWTHERIALPYSFLDWELFTNIVLCPRSPLCSGRTWRFFVPDVDSYEILSSVPTHQSFEVHLHFLANFCWVQEPWNHRQIPTGNLDVLCMQSLLHCEEHCVHPWLFWSKKTWAMFVVALKLPSSTVKNALTLAVLL